MEVRAKKALGQHFLTDQGVARSIVAALGADSPARDVLEIGPGMGVLTQYLLGREDIDLKLIEIDSESVAYLLTHLPGMEGRLMEGDYLRLDMARIFPGPYPSSYDASAVSRPQDLPMHLPAAPSTTFSPGSLKMFHTASW